MTGADEALVTLPLLVNVPFFFNVAPLPFSLSVLDLGPVRVAVEALAAEEGAFALALGVDVPLSTPSSDTALPFPCLLRHRS